MNLIKKYRIWRKTSELKKLIKEIELAHNQVGRYSEMDPNTIDILLWGKYAKAEELQKQIGKLI